MMRDEELLAKRLSELSRQSFHRGIITYTDFLNLNEQTILHALPKDSLYTGYILFGGYDSAERQMAAFLPEDALSLRGRYTGIPGDSDEKEGGSTGRYFFKDRMAVLRITPLHEKYSDSLTHRDYLGAIMNLGLERGKIGDILIDGPDALVFIDSKLKEFLREELTRIRHTSVSVSEEDWDDFQYIQNVQETRGTVSSLRLDALLSLAFASSRSKFTGLIEAGKVFVNGRLMTSNGYHIKEQDIISVRGMGKFQYVEQLSVTKKNRICVRIHKYI
nr:YlmH/Sll1252 family protein [uncultured Schaedlerella sp.]